MVSYKEKIEKAWTKAGGLISKSTAAKILNVDRSAITRSTKLTKFKINNEEFVSYTEVINNNTIKPRQKRK